MRCVGAPAGVKVTPRCVAEPDNRQTRAVGHEKEVEVIGLSLNKCHLRGKETETPTQRLRTLNSVVFLAKASVRGELEQPRRESAAQRWSVEAAFCFLEKGFSSDFPDLATSR